MVRDDAVGESSGNVFVDLSIGDPEDALRKADAAVAIVSALRERGLTQVEASILLGLKQPDVSNLMRGKLAAFSIDRLIQLMARAGLDVTISASRAPRSRPARVSFIVKDKRARARAG